MMRAIRTALPAWALILLVLLTLIFHLIVYIDIVAAHLFA
jgi:hypothetical protein